MDDTITFADIDIINPRKELFKYFIDNYKKECNFRDSEENLSNRKNSNLDIYIDMHELAQRGKTLGNQNKPSELVNMVSLSMLIRCDAFSILILGDSFPQERSPHP